VTGVDTVGERRLKVFKVLFNFFATLQKRLEAFHFASPQKKQLSVHVLHKKAILSLIKRNFIIFPAFLVFVKMHVQSLSVSKDFQFFPAGRKAINIPFANLRKPNGQHRMLY